jgi:hypothetical protein
MFIPNIALWDYYSTASKPILKNSTEVKIIVVEMVISFPFSEGILIIPEN